MRETLAVAGFVFFLFVGLQLGAHLIGQVAGPST